MSLKSIFLRIKQTEVISEKMKIFLAFILTVIFAFLVLDKTSHLNFYTIYRYLNSLSNTDFLSDIIAFEALLIGVAIPIGLQVVMRAADKYRDHEIAKVFADEFLYKSLFILLIINIAVVVTYKFLSINSTFWLWVFFICFIINIILFFKFIKLVERYSTDMDGYLMEKLKNAAKNLQ